MSCALVSLVLDDLAGRGIGAATDDAHTYEELAAHMQLGTSRVVLIFDGTCGFCSRWVRWVRERDQVGRLLAVPNQELGIIEMFGLRREDVDSAAWTIDTNGRRLSGAAAINRALAELGNPWAVLARIYDLRPAGWLEDLIYSWMAAHRQLLSRWWGETQCGIREADSVHRAN